MRRKYSIEDVRAAVKKNYSMAGVLRELGLKPIGGNYKTIKSLISHNDIDTSHFTGQGWNIGLKFNPQRKVTNEEIFVADSSYVCSWRLRERYKVLTGINHCQSCGLSEWLDKPISLEIHHVNGNNRDNRLDNLLLLCPNCHAQTETYRGRSRKK